MTPSHAGCPDMPCYCAENTEYLEENLRMVPQPFGSRVPEEAT